MPPNIPPKTIEQRCANGGNVLRDTWRSLVVFAQNIEGAGGRAYLVGGAVRDLLQNVVPSDFDLEVHQLAPEVVEREAEKLGRVSSVGRIFGILKIHVGNSVVDVSLPRRETKLGAGHRDFSVGIDPAMGVATAARRRDFTIGAIYLDILTGAIDDPFNGAHDLEQKCLRVVDPRTFVEDPLRLLRGLQLTARFALTVDPETLVALQHIVPSMGALATDRVREEWKKLLLAPKPSLGLRLGQTTGYLEQWHPELSALWLTPQDAREHPEGNVWEHTLLALDQINAITSVTKLPVSSRLVVALATLLHDIGKPIVTRNVEGRFRADGYEAAGLAPASAILQRLGIDSSSTAKILALVRTHRLLDQTYVAAQHGAPPVQHELHRLVRHVQPATVDELLVVTAADQLGRGPFPRPDGLVSMPTTYPGLEWWQHIIATNKLLEPMEPILWGRDLVERHWPPGPMIGEAVRLADQLGLRGLSRAEVLHILETCAKPYDALASLRTLVAAEGGETYQPAARSAT